MENKRPFGTTPREEIEAALIKNGARPYQGGPIWAWQMLKNIPGPDLLNLLDSLILVSEDPLTLPGHPLREWARDTRIAILASLGLGES